MAVAATILKWPKTAVRREAGLDVRREPAQIHILPCVRREALRGGQTPMPPQ